MKKLNLLFFFVFVISGLIHSQTLDIYPKNEFVVLGYDKLQILSINNSLIDYNDQPSIFNPLATAAGKNAVWEKQTRLGQSLRYHYEEGDGANTARAKIKSKAWTHIILQEQSSKPITNYTDFLASVKLWVTYIRENCPNPDARIILFMNWPYTDATDFEGDMNTLWNNYMMVARETGVSVYPVGKAYDIILKKDGVATKNSLYSDNRHPTLLASYLSSCIILSELYDINPEGIGYYPNGISLEQASLMQTRANEASQTIANTCDVKGKIYFSGEMKNAQGNVIAMPTTVNWSVSGGGTIDQNGVFTSNGVPGTYTAYLSAGGLNTSTTFQVKSLNVPVSLANLTITPSNASIVLGATQQFTVNGFDLSGNPYNLTNPTTWTVDGTAAIINSTGLFSSTKKGIFTVTASNSGISKSTTIDVLPQNQNLSIGATATASSGGASLAIDNNIASRWESTQGVDPQWIKVDLGELKNVSDIIIKWETAAAKDYIIEYSLDNVNWNTLISKTNMSATADRVDRIYDVNVQARYVRITGTSRTTQYGYSIFELQIYGTGNQGNIPSFSFTTIGSITKNPGDNAFSNIAFSTNSLGQISYSSSNQGVAIVNPTTGEVNIIGVGTTIITANISEYGDYSSATTSYILYVNELTVAAEISTTTSYQENFDGLSNNRAAILPDGWRVERMTGNTAQRVVGNFSNAVNFTTYIGGENMSATAKNGIYNFGAGDSIAATDRALGGSTTGAFTSTQGVNFYLHLRNTGIEPISSLNISYDIEKYRYGNNAAGFTIQMYSSENGVNWVSSGDNFKTQFSADATTGGSASVPILTRNISANLPVDLLPNQEIYLVWNYSVSSGTTSSYAQQLALDNILIEAEPGIKTKNNEADLSTIRFTFIDNILEVKEIDVNKILIYNINGIKVKENHNSNQINLLNLNSGVYIAKITDKEDKASAIKIIKK